MDPERRAKLLLAATSILVVLCAALACLAVWSWTRAVRLEQLSPGDRLRVLDQAERVSPGAFREFLFSGSPGFYQLLPGKLHENVYGATFTTNELGFRAPATPKPRGLRRLLIVGDSWVFGPFVPPELTFPQQLERMLNRSGERWQVYSLGMMGWNTENELAAMRQLMPLLDPDLVVVCPTPNDADEAFQVWGGRLVTRGFTSQAILRHSYMHERLWVEAFRKVQAEIDELKARQIPTLVYFLADWVGMVPYYAKLSDFTARYVVVPGEYLEGGYRLPGWVDPGEHATVEGHAVIATYLHNALVEAGLVADLERLPQDRAVEFPGWNFDPAAIDRQFAEARNQTIHVHGTNRMPVDPEFMLQRGIYCVPAEAGSRIVRVELRLLDVSWLYPLTIEARLDAPEEVVERRVFGAYQEHVPPIELRRPPSLDAYDLVDVVLSADRIIVPPGKAIPVSMFHPRIQVIRE